MVSVDAGQVSDAKHKVVHEKKEPPIFWKILGGKLKYADSPRLLEDLDENPARLFAISNAKGKQKLITSALSVVNCSISGQSLRKQVR